MNRVGTLLAAAAIVGFATGASAAPMTEIEANGSIATAQVIPGSAFTLPVPVTVYNPPGYQTASINGQGGDLDVDFFSFMATGGNAYFDIDNNPFSFDTILSLFNSSGTLLAYDDDSGPEDLGTAFGLDSFLGVFTLPGPGTYYIAVSQFANFPTSVDFNATYPLLTRPDGGQGGFIVTGAPAGVSTFLGGTTGNGSSPYTLHVSVQNPVTTAVPEPVTLLLFGAGLAAAAARGRRLRR